MRAGGEGKPGRGNGVSPRRVFGVPGGGFRVRGAARAAYRPPAAPAAPGAAPPSSRARLQCGAAAAPRPIYRQRRACAPRRDTPPRARPRPRACARGGSRPAPPPLLSLPPPPRCRGRACAVRRGAEGREMAAAGLRHGPNGGPQ